VSETGDILRSIDGPLTDSLRVELGVWRAVEYLQAARFQQQRVEQWLYGPEPRRRTTTVPLDQGTALCEAHFLFICWDTIRKTIDHLRQNAYGLVTSRETLRRYGEPLRHYSIARDHLEHLTERYPGRHRSDWEGDSNSISGSVPGIRRTGHFVFQGLEWDVTESSIVLLGEIVAGFVNGITAELRERRNSYLRGESAVRRT